MDTDPKLVSHAMAELGLVQPLPGTVQAIVKGHIDSLTAMSLELKDRVEAWYQLNPSDHTEIISSLRAENSELRAEMQRLRSENQAINFLRG